MEMYPLSLSSTSAHVDLFSSCFLWNWLPFCSCSSDERSYVRSKVTWEMYRSDDIVNTTVEMGDAHIEHLIYFVPCTWWCSSRSHYGVFLFISIWSFIYSTLQPGIRATVTAPAWWSSLIQFRWVSHTFTDPEHQLNTIIHGQIIQKVLRKCSHRFRTCTDFHGL